jgi:hypothetical protein
MARCFSVYPSMSLYSCFLGRPMDIISRTSYNLQHARWTVDYRGQRTTQRRFPARHIYVFFTQSSTQTKFSLGNIPKKKEASITRQTRTRTMVHLPHFSLFPPKKKYGASPDIDIEYRGYTGFYHMRALGETLKFSRDLRGTPPCPGPPPYQSTTASGSERKKQLVLKRNAPHKEEDKK